MGEDFGNFSKCGIHKVMSSRRSSPKVESRYIFKPAALCASEAAISALSGPAPRNWA